MGCRWMVKGCWEVGVRGWIKVAGSGGVEGVRWSATMGI